MRLWFSCKTFHYPSAFTNTHSYQILKWNSPEFSATLDKPDTASSRSPMKHICPPNNSLRFFLRALIFFCWSITCIGRVQTRTQASPSIAKSRRFATAKRLLLLLLLRQAGRVYAQRWKGDPRLLVDARSMLIFPLYDFKLQRGEIKMLRAPHGCVSLVPVLTGHKLLLRDRGCRGGERDGEGGVKARKWMRWEREREKLERRVQWDEAQLLYWFASMKLTHWERERGVEWNEGAVVGGFQRRSYSVIFSKQNRVLIATLYW